MELKERAVKVVDLICSALDPLFKHYGFDIKLRESDQSIFNEIVGYQKGDVVFRISACLHPHDYPNSLNVYLVKKVPGEWKSFSLNELLKVIGKNGIDTYEQFLVEPQSKIERTISSLKEICESLLASEVYLKIK